MLFLFLLTAALVILCLLVFIPKSYPVPEFAHRPGTRYWTLKTGSRIGHTLLPGTGQKRPFPVIFLQGGPGGYISDRNIAILAPLTKLGYDVYLYDQVGSGHSARLNNLEEYTAVRHKQDLEEIVKQVGAEKVILIGQSWGAVLATLYLADNPEKVARLVLTGPGPIFPIRPETETEKAPDSLHLKEPPYKNRMANQKTASLRSRAMEFFATELKVRLAPDAEADQFKTYLDNALNKAIVCDTANALPADAGGGYYASVMTLQSLSVLPDIRAKLRNLPVPVLLLKGQCDNQKWGYAKEYLQLFPNATLKVISNAGHSISVEQPEVYQQHLLQFLQ